MKRDFLVNYVVRLEEENGDISIWTFQTWEEAYDWLMWLRGVDPHYNTHAQLVTLPIPLSHLLYFSGLREAGEAIRNGARPISP